jgi:pimeloyl-ACP methyl ester carboxylesterase
VSANRPGPSGIDPLYNRITLVKGGRPRSSYGGFLALNQAILAPERVDRIVLISPAACFVGFGWKFYYAMFVKGPLRRLMRKWHPKPTEALPGGTKLVANGWGKLMETAMMESARPNLARAIVFSRGQLKAVRAPTLLLIGEDEVLYKPYDTIALAKSRLPGLSGDVIAGADHLASLSAPDEVNERILRFFRP